MKYLKRKNWLSAFKQQQNPKIF